MKFDECKFREVHCSIDEHGIYRYDQISNYGHVEMSWGKWKGESMPYALVNGKIPSEVLDRATESAYKDLVDGMRADYRVLENLLKEVETIL